jgi:radical SAM protein with 4Fe4S-binding SPASM domain
MSLDRSSRVRVSACLAQGKALFHRVYRVLGALARHPAAREALVNNCLKELSYAHRLRRSLGRPQIFQIETTNCCQYTCIMCPRTHAMTRRLGHMDLGLFRAIIDQLRPGWQMNSVRGQPEINLFHFGEPTLYKHFFESIAHCHTRGLSVRISTNPSAWNERRTREALDVGLDTILFRVDGMDDSTSMAIRGAAASYVRGEANIREFVRQKVERGAARTRVEIAMVKQPRNAHQWEIFKTHWQGMEGIDLVFLDDYSCFGGDVPEVNRVGAQAAAGNAVQAARAERWRQASQLPCYYPWHSVSVTWDGRVVPCCKDYDAQTVLGDLTKETLQAIWNGAPLQRLRDEFKRGKLTMIPCQTCNERSLEIVLPGRFYPPALVTQKLAMRAASRQKTGKSAPQA